MSESCGIVITAGFACVVVDVAELFTTEVVWVVTPPKEDFVALFIQGFVVWYGVLELGSGRSVEVLCSKQKKFFEFRWGVASVYQALEEF